MVNLDFCITYLKNTKFNLVTHLTATKIFFVYSVNCCSNYTNIVSNTIHAGIPCIFWFIDNNIFFTKCCMVGCSIQNNCSITTQIESSICKLVEQN